MIAIKSNLLPVLAHCYFLLALAYNVASQVLLDITGRKLTPTDPGFSIVDRLCLNDEPGGEGEFIVRIP